MRDTLFIAMISIFSAEYCFCLPIASFGKYLLVAIKKSVWVVTSQRISDHWKERVAICYAIEIMKNTIYILLILLGLLLLIVAVSLLFDWLVVGRGPTAEDILLEPLNWALMALVASTYLYFRNRYARS